MDRFGHKIILVITLFFLIQVPPAMTQEYTCYLSAPQMDDIWVIVYSSDREGNREDVIWQGKIPAGERIEVSCDTGHIRYEYAMEKDQPYEGDVDRWCEGGDEIQLP